MRIGHDQVYLTLSANRLAAAVVRGTRVLREDTVQLDQEQWSNAWAKGLAPMDPPLRRILSRLSPGKKPDITVFYCSPSAILHTRDVRSSRRDAREAAIMHAKQGVSVNQLYSARIVGPSESKDADWTVLTVSEREDTANMIYAWISRCGGELRTIVPIQSAVALAAVDQVQSHPDANAVCVLSQDWTAVACGSERGIQLIRVFELGYGSLADAYLRALPDLTPTTATELLFKDGLPFNNRDISHELRSVLLPMLSPIVQRLSVEVKQTLRYGIDQSKPINALTLAGRGATIPDLGKALSDGVDLHVNAPEPRPFDGGFFAECGSEYHYLMHSERIPTICPAPAAASRTAGTLKRAVLAGALLAAGLVAGEYMLYTYRAKSLEPQFARISPAIASAAAKRDAVTRAGETAVAVGNAARRIADARAGSQDPGALLRIVSSATSERGIGLYSIDLRGGKNETVLAIRGAAHALNDDAAGAAVAEAASIIEQSPLVLRVEIGAIERESTPDGGAVRRFDMNIVPHDAEPAYMALVRFATAQGDNE